MCALAGPLLLSHVRNGAVLLLVTPKDATFFSVFDPLESLTSEVTAGIYTS